jgi:hypothetical protein
MILGVILRVLVCYVMIWMRVCLVDCVDPTTLFSIFPKLLSLYLHMLVCLLIMVYPKVWLDCCPWVLWLVPVYWYMPHELSCLTLLPC